MASTQTLDNELALLVSTNPTYTDNRERWRYHLQAYLGGDDWRQGQHLTRYQLETNSEYAARLASTPYENHSRAVISVYTSFLFQQEPERDLGSLANQPEILSFLEDADLEGRSLKQFLRDVSTWSSVFGHCWILMAKPNIGASSRADEIQAGVRPYLNLLLPLSVTDWRWVRSNTGYYELEYLKYVEDINGDTHTIKEWYPDRIVTTDLDIKRNKINNRSQEINELGTVPAVCAYNARSVVRGLGVSDIGDIADLSKSIYNMLSEVEQSVRLDGHPSLVKTPETIAGAGAGSIISIPDNLDAGLKPYLLEHGGANIDSIYKAIAHATQAIDQLSHTGGVRSTESRTMSGVAMQTEFQLLNAKLSEKADNLELVEEQLWQLFAQYQGQVWTGEIDYPDSFSIQDEQQEYANLQMARNTATGAEALALVDQLLIQLLSDDSEYESESGTEHPVVPGPADPEHIQQMLMSGSTNAEILAMHPDVTVNDIVAAAASAARDNN